MPTVLILSDRNHATLISVFLNNKYSWFWPCLETWSRLRPLNDCQHTLSTNKGLMQLGFMHGLYKRILSYLYNIKVIDQNENNYC